MDLKKDGFEIALLKACIEVLEPKNILTEQQSLIRHV
jgi:hypothetical protein